MAMAILMALIHRKRTGEGQWIDLACTEAALTLHGPALLDWTVNGRPSRREGQPNSNRNRWPAMAPHGIYPCAGEDEWAAIACRDDADWAHLAALIGEPWAAESRFASLEARLENEDALETRIGAWTAAQQKFALQQRLRAAGVPCSAVQKPAERVDHDPDTEGLWPTVTHTAIGEVRVDGIPARFSKTPWRIAEGAPTLGEDNEEVFGRLLGLSRGEVAQLHEEGVI
jgi:crotonobetainyl-CoA:carnitine CoA-transferase CaiB-like acyl-CoA transferase